MSTGPENILVTGGAGFIGANFVRAWLREREGIVVNVDKLTYAGNLENLADVRDEPRHVFVQADVCDAQRMLDLMRRYRVSAVVHLAAETHVDRSILGPDAFVRTNVIGVHRLLEAARAWYREMDGPGREDFRVLHVSTDEVYGSLDAHAPPCAENSPYAPSSPYAASKAAADHLVRAYYRTYGLPALITNCTNNFGPRQHPEKLIPLAIVSALEGRPIPIYGDGRNVRDWLYVEDHCEALRLVLEHGRPGETYHVSAGNERDNLTVVAAICDLVDQLAGERAEGPRRGLVTLVPDRPGHDRRYALAADRIRGELGWCPRRAFDKALRETVGWYLANLDWVAAVCASDDYTAWVERNYAARSAS